MLRRFIAALLLAFAWPCMACSAAELENPGASVKVVDARIVTREVDKRLLVTVLGNLKNETGLSVRSLTVEAKLLDAQGQVVDVLTRYLDDIIVMPGDQVAFRIQDTAASPLAAYAQVQARVTSGYDQRPQTQAKTKAKADSDENLIFSLIVSYGPMLLLIGVWLFFMRRVSGKKAPQTSLMAEQIKLIAEQNALILRQVTALEKLAKIERSETAPPPPKAPAARFQRKAEFWFAPRLKRVGSQTSVR